jgi:hypothetical protein
VSHPRRQKFTNEIYSIKSHQNVNWRTTVTFIIWD